MGVQVIPIPTEVVSHSLPFPFPILCFIPIPMGFPRDSRSNWESLSHAQSSEVSCVEPSPSMVLRSRARGGRSSAAVPDVETRPETETRPEPELASSAEIQVPVSVICEGGLGATEPHIPDTASQCVTADKPETIAAFPESNPNLTPNPNPPPHTLFTKKADISITSCRRAAATVCP